MPDPQTQTDWQDTRERWVYILEASGTQYFKIGVTSQSLEDRVSTLQTGNHRKLEVFAAAKVRDAENIEAKAHQMVQQHQAHGEWFALSLEQAEEVWHFILDELRFQELRPAERALTKADSGFGSSEVALFCAIHDLLQQIRDRHSSPLPVLNDLVEGGHISQAWEKQIHQEMADRQSSAERHG